MPAERLDLVPLVGHKIGPPYAGAEFDLGSPLPCRIAKETFKFHCTSSILETCPYVCTWFLLPPVVSTGARPFPVNKENEN